MMAFNYHLQSHSCPSAKADGQGYRFDEKELLFEGLSVAIKFMNDALFHFLTEQRSLIPNNVRDLKGICLIEITGKLNTSAVFRFKGVTISSNRSQTIFYNLAVEKPNKQQNDYQTSNRDGCAEYC